MTWLYGAVAISSGITAVSWGTAALRFRRRWRDGWNTSPLLIAIALAIGAAALTGLAMYRAYDAAILGYSAEGSEPAFLVTAWAALLVSEFLLVRAAHLDVMTLKIRNGWTWFLIVMAVWIALVMALVGD